jgi:hypothetical protein
MGRALANFVESRVVSGLSQLLASRLAIIMNSEVQGGA